ncbi:MAG: DNA polymerase I [Planctomycetota bacterium]|nr:DNA polymerase I [Planctomycetota bacterium]
MTSPSPPVDPQSSTVAEREANSEKASPDLTGKTVWVIDTLSRVYQLFHALPEMSSPTGTPVQAVYGFTKDLLGIIEKRKPDYLFCAMDAPGPTFRHIRHAAYKGTRAEMPGDLVPQIPLVRQLCATMGIPCLELSGFEADDILATLTAAVTARGGSVTLATSDKDARQLLSDRVKLLNLRTNSPLGPDELRADWGVRPDQVVDWLSLVGDTADNVPGVPSIGPKSATELLQQFGDLDSILARTAEVKGAKKQENLRLHADTARAARELVRLDSNVPIDIPWDAARLHRPDAEALSAFLEGLGFQSLVKTARLASEPAQPKASPAKKTSAKPAKPDDRQGRLLLGDDDEPSAASVLPTFETPADDAALAGLVEGLRSMGSVTLAVALPPGATRLTAPVGIGIVSGARAAWVPAALLTGSGPGRGALAALLADPATPKAAHDLKRQELALGVAGFGFAGGVFDTLLAGYLLDAGQRNHSLGAQADLDSIGSGDDLDTVEKEVRQTRLESPANAADAVAACRATTDLVPLLATRLEEQGLGALFKDVEIPLASILAAMEYHGMRIDASLLERLSARYTERLAALEGEIHCLAGHSFAIASPIQVRAVLFDELGLPVVKRTKTGPSTDAEVLEELAPRHPLPRLLLEHRKFAKLKSTYVDALPLLVEPSTGCIHTTFNQTVAATGRLSSSDPNLQNIPVRTEEGQQIRAAFVPRDPANRFVAADYSQIELRILAHLSGDAAMRRAFASGEDIHSSTAAAVFGVTADGVTSEMRRAAKAVNFGILYGQSAFGLAKGLGIPQAEAATFIAAYFHTFSGAEAFIDDCLDRCRRDGSVSTMLGRRRAIEKVRDRAGRRTSAGVFSLTLPERTAVNTVVQGSAADLIKLAMLRVQRRLAAEGLAAAIVLQIHDELLLEVPAGEIGIVRPLLVAEMKGAMTLEVPLEVTVHEGATWAACEK